ncbi:hypothetical protein QFZ65_001780 [Arthrobacter sp. B3I9]|nr:hypothetical protein [Arthrobacter sp. B3I9]
MARFGPARRAAAASFRMGLTERRFDRTAGRWVDGNTN